MTNRRELFVCRSCLWALVVCRVYLGSRWVLGVIVRAVCRGVVVLGTWLYFLLHTLNMSHVTSKVLLEWKVKLLGSAGETLFMASAQLPARMTSRSSLHPSPQL